MQTPNTMSLKTLFVQSWHQVKGSKSDLWYAWLFIIVISCAVFVAELMVQNYILTLKPTEWVAIQFLQLVTMIITYFFTASLLVGVVVYSLKRMRREVCEPKEIFKHKALKWGCFQVLLIQSAIDTLIQIIILSLPVANHLLVVGAVGAVIHLLLIVNLMVWVDQKVSPWQATVKSAQLIIRHFFKSILLFIVVMLINMLCVFTLCIGLIWVLPFSYFLITGFYLQISGQQIAAVQ